jgi:hypothetical protein
MRSVPPERSRRQLLTKGENMKDKKIKPEYLPGGAKREEARANAVKYLQAPIPVTQQERHSFLTTVLKFTETEYLDILNQAGNGALEESVWN